MKKALKTAARGTVFPYAGEKWVVLEHDPAGRTLCLRLEVIPDKPFDEDNRNNFAISSSKEWMNGPYLDNLIDAVKGPHAFLTTELDLTADDGLKDYGTCTVTIFSLTVDQYRRNRDVIPLVDDWYWLSTAYSTAANGYEHSARYVSSGGALSMELRLPRLQRPAPRLLSGLRSPDLRRQRGHRHRPAGGRHHRRGAGRAVRRLLRHRGAVHGRGLFPTREAAGGPGNGGGP